MSDHVTEAGDAAVGWRAAILTDAGIVPALSTGVSWPSFDWQVEATCDIGNHLPPVRNCACGIHVVRDLRDVVQYVRMVQAQINEELPSPVLRDAVCVVVYRVSLVGPVMDPFWSNLIPDAPSTIRGRAEQRIGPFIVNSDKPMTRQIVDVIHAPSDLAAWLDEHADELELSA